VYICYKEKAFNEEASLVIEEAQEILEEYQEMDLDVTLRQLYYVFIAKDLFPEDRRWRWTGSKWVRDPNGTKNALPNYKWMGKIITDGRRAGQIDWDMIKDRTREVQKNAHWGSPREVLSAVANQFRVDMWSPQPYSVRAWVEKDAMLGIMEKACKGLDVPYLSCRGYVSDSAIWEAAQAMVEEVKVHRTPVVIHLGDHDPSGVDMTNDIINRLKLFGGEDLADTLIVNRIALTMDQIEEYGSPPSPAKITDSRAKAYIEEYGDESWELDALEPPVLIDLIKGTIGQYIDTDRWSAAETIQNEGRKALQLLTDHFDEATKAAKDADYDPETGG